MDLLVSFNTIKVINTQYYLILSYVHYMIFLLYQAYKRYLPFCKDIVSWKFSILDGDAIEVMTFDVSNNVTNLKTGRGHLWGG